MQFSVPQFIEREMKVVGPMTFKQFIVVAVAGIICFAAYYKLPFIAFIFVAILVGGGAIVFSFLKIGGRPPLLMLKNFFLFSTSPKIFLWHKKIFSTKSVIKKDVKKEVIDEEESPLKIIRKSRLKNLASKVETKTK